MISTAERGSVARAWLDERQHADNDVFGGQVGAIDPERIDLTWEAAIKHGFALVPDPA